MGLIRITPEEIRRVASEFKGASTDSDAMVNRLEKQVQAMETEWDGVTKTRFYDEFRRWDSAMKEFVVLLEHISTDLEAVATRFEAADQQA